MSASRVSTSCLGVALGMLVPLAGCGGSSTPAAEEPDERMAVGERPDSRRAAYPNDDDDEDVDENLSVEGLRGRMEPYDIQRGIEPHAQAISDCFTRNIKRKGYIGGKVVLKYVVTRQGGVKTVQIAESDLGAWPIEACLLETARAMSFARPKGGEADFTVPLDFPATRPVQWWSEEQAETVVGDKLALLGDCAAAGTAPRNAWITLYVGARGEVQSVGFASPADAPIDDAWAGCAADAIKAWKLADPRGQVAKLGFRYNPE